MQNLRITENQLTDGSITFAVAFEATHADSTQHTVVLESYGHSGALALYDQLNALVAFAETNPSGARS